MVTFGQQIAEQQLKKAQVQSRLSRTERLKQRLQSQPRYTTTTTTISVEQQIRDNLISYDKTIADARLKAESLREKYRRDRKRGKSSDKQYERVRKAEIYLDDLINNRTKVEQGYELGGVIHYASDQTRATMDSREAQDRFQSDVKSGKYDLKKVGLKEGATQKEYSQAVKEYNSNVAYQNQLLSWTDKVGFEKLPEPIKEEMKKRGLVTETTITTTPSSDFKPVYANVKGYETIFPTSGIITAGKISKSIYSPFQTQKEVLTGFENTKLQQSIPLANLNVAQKKQLVNEGWDFGEKKIINEIPSFLTTEQYKQQFPKPTIFQKAMEKYADLESQASGIIKKNWSPISFGGKTYEESYANMEKELIEKPYPLKTPVLWLQSKVPKAVGKPVYEFLRGETEYIEEHPITFTATTVAFAGLTAGLGYAGRGVSWFGKKTGISTVLASTKPFTLPQFAMAKISPAQLWTGTKIAGGVGITALYGKSVYTRVMKSEEGTRSYALGRIAGAEITPMILGGFIGAKASKEFEGYLRTRGRTEINLKRLVPKDVDIVGGKNIFPEAPKKLHYKLFMEQSQRTPALRLEGYSGKGKLVYSEEVPVKMPSMLYHQTGNQFWKSGKPFTVEYNPSMESSEFKALFGSYGVSPHFLKVTGKYKPFSLEFLPETPRPATVAIIPAKWRVDNLKAKWDLGTALIPMNKKEVQALLGIGTINQPLSKDFYYTIQGIRIPLDIYKSEIGKTALAGVMRITPSISTPRHSSGINPSTMSSSALYSKINSILYPKSSKISSRVSSPKYSLKSSLKSIISKQSSYISKPSVSKVSYPKFSSSRVSPISSMIMSIISSTTRASRYSIPPFRLPTSLKGKIKSKVKFRKFPEIFGAMPDFSARAIGLEPKMVSLKQAMKEMRKIQTGFEVRTGLRLKGYSNPSEKNLLKGIMQ